MSQAATLASPKLNRPTIPAVPSNIEFEDNSPFGLQGLSRETIRILKPEFITRLAITLSLRGTRRQIRDMDFVNRVLSYDETMMDEYQVVHLIERSLWIQGHSDLVMTMTRNPSQIPGNPPPKGQEALARAYATHPQSTIWYGVPLFSDARNEEGLPIPVTAAEVRAEADRRIKAAQSHALNWGWMYRALMGVARFPSRCWRGVQLIAAQIEFAGRMMGEYWKRAREDARRRARAEIKAHLERVRYGCAYTQIPGHRTWLGQGIDTATLILEYEAAMAAYLAPIIGVGTAPLVVAKFAPLLFFPLTIVSCDPFLFVELPEEPGKLRHIGHWYWQTESKGRQKLHLHV